MPTMLILGDSILWGQGLPEEQKSSRLLANAWSASLGGAPIREVRYAHSGADIWDDNQSGILAAINPFPPRFTGNFSVGDGAIEETRASVPTTAPGGEIPNEEPYLLAQLLAARESLAAAPPDLILLDMGINDTEVYNLVLPGKDTNALVRRAQSLAPRVLFVMDRIRASFPAAKVLVTGYYAVVSEQTEADELLQFTDRVVDAIVHAELDVPAPLQLAIQAAAGPAIDELVPRLARHSAAWKTAMHGVLTDAVAAFNAAGSVSAFVDPDFRPEHAVFAPESLLWRYDHGNPTDPMADARRAWCREKRVIGFDALAVECASMGHPAPLGARRYAEKMVAQASAIGVF